MPANTTETVAEEHSIYVQNRNHQSTCMPQLHSVKSMYLLGGGRISLSRIRKSIIIIIILIINWTALAFHFPDLRYALPISFAVFSLVQSVIYHALSDEVCPMHCPMKYHALSDEVR